MSDSDEETGESEKQLKIIILGDGASGKVRKIWQMLSYWVESDVGMYAICVLLYHSI